MAESKGRSSLRLVTYNIHKGIGGIDRKYRPERIIRVLKACRADLILLQEVDEGVPRSRGDRQVDLLGDALGMEHRAYFPNVFLKRGRYGNAILSRYPLDHHENIDLTRRLRKRRGALHARLTVPNGSRRFRLWVYNVHLGLAETERRSQLRSLLGWHAGHRVHASTVVLLAGDFNDVWRKLGRGMLEPAGFQGLPTRPRTFPAVRPLRPLDAVFVRGPARFSRQGTGAADLVREASDHLPIVVSLRLG
ncbi:MAG: endonuclease/exonuclease/phosphatase family protein [Planctomycetota bacterium]